MERWVCKYEAQIGCLFGLSGLLMAPFLYLKTELNIDCNFAKCLNSINVPFGIFIGCPKITYASQFSIYMVKSTNWF